MKKFITVVFCTALALSSGFTAYAAEAPDRESLETAIWEDLWNGKGDNGLEYPEASYKHHLLDKWLDDNYGTGGYDWTDVGEVTHGYRRYYRDLIDGWDFEDDNSGNWTIETEDNFYSFTLLNGTWQMIDRNGDIPHDHELHRSVTERTRSSESNLHDLIQYLIRNVFACVSSYRTAFCRKVK